MDEANDRLDRGKTNLGNHAVLEAFYDVGEQRMIEQGCHPTGDWI